MPFRVRHIPVQMLMVTLLIHSSYNSSKSIFVPDCVPVPHRLCFGILHIDLAEFVVVDVRKVLSLQLEGRVVAAEDALQKTLLATIRRVLQLAHSVL
jgi:hypothetical protein